MFKIGDKVIVKGYGMYGIGEITYVNYLTSHYNIYFKDVDMYVINIPQNVIFLTTTIQSKSYSLQEVLKELSTKLNKTNLYNEFKFGDFNMPNITNHKYTEDTAVTTIEWSDGTKTTVRAEYPETADPYTGFVTACAKKAFGNNNTINKLFDEWAVKKPEREMKTKIKANAAELEAKRIAEKRKTKREKWLIRRRAAEINREYEARKLANDKYGVPMDEKKGE